MRTGRTRGTLLTGLLLLAVMAAACGESGKSSRNGQSSEPKGEGAATAPPLAASAAQAAPESLNPADFSTKVDNPLFPLSSFRTIEFAGSERDPETGETIKTRTEKRLLERTDTIGGVGVAILEVKDYENGELVELTEDYFAQHRDGSVWYFGERVNDYEDGRIVGHEGQWLAGEGGDKAGLYMPAKPIVGQVFEQERAPGVAEDRSKVLALDVEVTVPAGTFTGCMKAEDFAPLDNVTEFKFYCPRVGLVREEGTSGSTQLVRFA